MENGGTMDHRPTALRRTDRGILLAWEDGLEGELTPWQLRVACPCAHCVSELTGEALLDPATVPQDLALEEMQPVGNYAYRCRFSDGHDSGIYTLELLRKLCEEPPESVP